MNSFSELSRRAFLGLVLTVAVTIPALAAEPLKLSPEQVTAISAINQYMNSFKTMQGEFTQISPKGNMSQGVFYISKPGKMRFEYAPPNPYLLVADGTWFTIKNVKKEKGDQFPLSQTPLRLVLGNDLDIVRDTNVIDFQDQDGMVAVTVEDKKSTLGSGQLTLVYDKSRNALQQWIVIDGKGRKTTVTLENVQAGVDIDPKLFAVKIKRDSKNGP